MLGAPLSVMDQRDGRLIGIFDDLTVAIQLSNLLWERIPVVTRPSVNPYKVSTVFVGKSCFEKLDY